MSSPEKCPAPPPPSPVKPNVLIYNELIDMMNQPPHPFDVGCEDKESTGCSLSHLTNSPHSSQSESLGSKDSLSLDLEDSFTGSSSLDSEPNSPSQQFFASLVHTTPSSPEAQQHPTMSGKTLPRSQVRVLKSIHQPVKGPASNLVPNRSRGIAMTTGNVYGGSPSKESFYLSQRPSVFRITGLSERSIKIMYAQLRSSELFMSSGVKLVVEKVAERGRRLGWELILSLPLLNSGMDTTAKRMLSAMNFEEISESRISSGGWIVTQSLWKLRGLQLHCAPEQSGSLPTYLQENGIRR